MKRFFICAAVFAIACLSLVAQEPKRDVINLMGGGTSSRIAEQNGIYAKYGIEVHASQMPNSEVMRSDLASGKIDIAAYAVDNAVAMTLDGADAIIVMGGDGSQNELVAQPEIKTLADLKGKTVLVDAPNTAYALQMKKIMLLGGLDPKEVQMKPGVTTNRRLQAIQDDKTLVATMLDPGSAARARRAGFNVLGTVPKDIGRYHSTGAYVMRKWAQEHSDILVRFIAANIEGQRWLMDPANKDKVIAMLTGDRQPPEIAAATYERQMHGLNGWTKDAGIDMEGFKNVLKIRADVEGSWGGKPPAPEKFYDASYYEKALKLVDKKK
jgi:ABC-type nitrate/sulfonate/bicarbonate transport system substrate-binding protein